MAEKTDLIQEIITSPVGDLLAIMQDTKTAGYRLGQACATLAGENIEVLYTFEKDNILKNLKFVVDAKQPELQSITAIYSYAFIYENEMHDLFGITFKNLSLDYGGKFFQISEETPWNPLCEKGGEN